MNGERSRTRGWRTSGAATAIVLGLVVSGCSGSGATPAGPTVAPTSGSTPASTAAATRSPVATTAAPSTAGSPKPAAGSVSFGGDQGLAGNVIVSGIRCQLPAIAGQTIAIFGTAPNGVLVQAILATGSIAIRIYTGSGATAAERNFASPSLASLTPPRARSSTRPSRPSRGPRPRARSAR